MCNRYAPPTPEGIERYWKVRPQETFVPGPIFPRSQGPFIRAAREQADFHKEVVLGQWALIPDFATSRTLSYSTNNARFEGVAQKASFKKAWLRGQRCVIPVEWFDEPCWETGRNIWWRFHRADGQPWGLAGLWNAWFDRTQGVRVESYTMLTLNADSHPLMSRMHKPDPKLPADQQDKRSVIPIELEEVDAWLFGTVEQAAELVKLAPADRFSAGPATSG